MTTRIVHLVTGLDVGGAEMMLVRLLGRMDRSRFDNHVISLLPLGALTSGLEAHGVPVSTLSMRRGLPSPIALARLVKALRRLRPSILQTWMYHADILGTVARALARVPVLVWNIRASDVDMSQYGWLSALTRRLGAAWSRRPNAVIVNSDAGRLAHERLGFRPRRWVVIPNGIDVEEFRPDAQCRTATRAALGLEPSTVAVGLVARFDPMKGHEVFLDAAARLARDHHGVHFLLAGAGVEVGNALLRGWIEAGVLQGRVSLLGVRRDIAALDGAFDIAVMASSFGEGFPTAIGEAMASGVPCVVTDVGDAARLVDATGWIVPPHDAAAMATALREAVGLPTNERASRGLAARERVVREFSLEQATKAYEDLYQSLAPPVRA